jgi:predicted membrane-bound spermidine synthase
MFMGGMALGSWLISRRTLTLTRLIAAYALVEAVIGLFGFAFHPLFVALTGFSQDHVLPTLQAPAAAAIWQWASAAALIAPQTALLGATFPLIAAGVLRAFPAGASSTQLGGLYFTNGIGAAAGALVATFVLLPAVGMQGALNVAAGMNLLLAVGTYWISKQLREGAAVSAGLSKPSQEASAGLPRLSRALLLATFCSSAASFGYEIGWVRMLNQALGTTLHGFELMLAAFIAGMALGGLWVQKRGAAISDLVRYAGFVQVAMGVVALLSVPLLARSYSWVGWLMDSLAPSAGGYTLYSLATALIAMIIMVPAAFFAGMTLPLFTAALLRQGASERVVGQVYAANTVGAIVGVVLTVHVLVPLMGVTLSVLFAASADVAVGLVLLRRFSPGRWTAGSGGAALLALGTLAVVLRVGMPDPLHQAAGVFRIGFKPTSMGELRYFRDGSTATISVRTDGAGLTIRTNGKPDAGLTPLDSAPTLDETTMLMLGALPLAAHPKPERVALIGWGSGLSTHTVLGSKVPKQVDTIEIEPAMWEGAKAFAPRNARAYSDPRSKVHFDDARKFLATHTEPYDVLISEPSNPWVSGVSSLFTQEFYRLVRRHLKEDGVLIQWIHHYEMSDRLLAEMVAALLAEFPNSEVYQAQSGDLVVLAFKGKRHGLSELPWDEPELASELRRVGLGSVHDFEARLLGGSALMRTYIRQHKARTHSDYWPTVALAAPGQRFQRSSAQGLSYPLTIGLPVLNVLACREPLGADQPVLRKTEGDTLGIMHQVARSAAAAVLEGSRSSALASYYADLPTSIDALLAQRSAVVPITQALAHQQLNSLAMATLGVLDTTTLQRLWDTDLWFKAPWQATPALRDQVGLYRAFARQDWSLARQAAISLLTRPDSALPPKARETTLLLGQLATLAGGNQAQINQWQLDYSNKHQIPEFGGLSDFINTWVLHEPVCAAQRAATRPGLRG